MSDAGSDDGGIPLIEELSASPEPQTSGKRKREDDSKTESKRAAKRKRSKKPKDIADDALDAETGVNHAISHMESQLLADHIAQRTKRFQKDLSLVELEDLHIPATAIVDTTDFGEQRTMENLPAYLEKYVGKVTSKNKKNRIQDAPKEKGRPHTLVIAGAGLRAADLTRSLRQFQTKESKVAKLFAKHIKLKEAIEEVKKTRMNIGVGTPQRVIDLLDDGMLGTNECVLVTNKRIGALSSIALERIVIDASHIDQKKRGVLDMKETQAPLVQLLARKEFQDRYTATEGRIQLLFF